MGRVTVRRSVTRIQVGADETTVVRRLDAVAAEEPLEIRVGPAGGLPQPLVVTMRTPGHDIDLAIGFLFTEALITCAADIATAALCPGTDAAQTYNVVKVSLAPGVASPARTTTRDFLTTSACGVCGKASIDSVRTRSAYDLMTDTAGITAATVVSLPERLRQAQKVFDHTGGLHAAGLFTRTGELVLSREDVGRHNAVDKVIGAALRSGPPPLSDRVMMVSGRASFELVQKAAMAGVAVLAAVSAPSSLAVELAHDVGLTLVGFVRGGSMNVYSHPNRIAGADCGGLEPGPDGP